MMPSENVVLLGSFRSVVPDWPPLVLTPPRLLPMVSPATICQLLEKRLLAVNSTPLKAVSR